MYLWNSIIIFIILALITGSALAVPLSFDWGSFDAEGNTSFGIYDLDDSTILETGDLVQLIWAGPDGLIDPPQLTGLPGGDDRLLDASAVNNGLPLPPPLQNKGYVPLSTFSFDSETPFNTGIVYFRAWNANKASEASAYGNSATALLTGGEEFNAQRWHTDRAISVSTLHLPFVIRAE